MVCRYAEEVCDARRYFVEEGLLRFLEGGFGEEFEVLYRQSAFSGRRNRGREVLGWFVELWISAESR